MPKIKRPDGKVVTITKKKTQPKYVPSNPRRVANNNKKYA